MYPKQSKYYLKNLAGFSLIWLLNAITLTAQNPNFIRYGIDQGLPSQEIYDVEQDNKGRIWIATDRGVARYNGYEFQSFDKKDGLATNTILKMFKDSKGKMWLCGFDGSLTCWDKEMFRTNEALKINQSKLTTDKNKQWIESIIEIDSTNHVYQYSINHGKRVWINNKFNLKDSSFSEYIIENPIELLDSKGYPANFLRSDKQLIDKKHKVLWHNTYSETSNEYILFIDKFNKVALDNNYNKVPIFKSAVTSTIYHIRNDTIIKELDLDEQVEDVLLHNGNIIVGTWEGVVTFNISQSYKKEIIFKDKIVTGLLIDNEDNLWLSTQNDGLILLPNFTRIKQLQVYIKDERPDNVDVFQNHLVISYMNGSGLEIIDSSLNKVFGIYDKSSVFYSGITIDNNIAYTSNTSQIFYSDKNFSFVPRMKKGNKQELPSRITLKLKSGDFLRGTSRAVIYNSPYRTPPAAKLQIHNAPFSALELPNGFVLVGCVGGLFEINLEKLDYKRIDTEKQIRIGSRVNHICTYDDSLLIFSTLGDGLILYNYQERQVVRNIKIENGLLSNQVNVSYLENDSTLWAGTNFGLSKINIALNDNKIVVNSIDNITTKEGLFSNFISSITKWNDELWVVTPSGTNHFKAEELKGNISNPSIFIDSTMLIPSNSIISSHAQLEHYENDLSFHFTGVTFRKPSTDNFYKYSLSKKNTTEVWLETNNRSIQFTNLEHGDYSFQVTARNNLNQWASSPAQFNFSIKKHFSETIWFRLLSLILVILLAYLLFRNRQAALLKKEKQKQKLKEAELNTKAAQLNALRNQMNPHFIYNALNSIQNFIFKNDAEKANYMLSRFGKLMRSSLELSKLEYIYLSKEIDFLENYLQLEIMRFGDKFTYTISKDPGLDENYKIPPLLIQPILENAIKHGFSDTKSDGIIKIYFKKLYGLIQVVVSDNGKGYSKIDDRSINSESPTALKIINERIDLLNEVNEKISSFKITPLSANSAITGTQVTIEIPYISEMKE